MKWSVTHSDEKVAIDELYYHASDRAVGIVVGSLVELRVTAMVKETMINEAESIKIRGETIHAKMFHSSGPLGSFSTKIRLAYLFKLITVECFRDLETLKDIRNLFAHDPSVGSFQVQAVADKCKNFRLVDRYVIEPDHGIHGDSEALFGYNVENAAERLKQPRDRYILTAQILSIGIQHASGSAPFWTPAF